MEHWTREALRRRLGRPESSFFKPVKGLGFRGLGFWGLGFKGCGFGRLSAEGMYQGVLKQQGAGTVSKRFSASGMLGSGYETSRKSQKIYDGDL